MPEKIDIYRSYGQKLISLFVRLLFTRESYSLTELSRMLGCSKQTVLRLLDDITTSYGVDIEERMEGKRKYVSLKRLSRTLPMTPLTELELTVLQMCKDFTSHLLGKQLFEEATRGLLKSQALINKEGKKTSQHFGAFRSGYIDYSPYYATICTLVQAMDSRRTCKLTYQAIMENKAKTYFINPLKIFSHRDTMYLHAQLAPSPDDTRRKPDFDPLLVIHRINKVELTDRTYVYPKKFSFEDTFNQNFGIIKDDEFEAVVEFDGWAARFVAERIWSQDQKIEHIGDGRIRLTLAVASETELVSWVLSFGNMARIIGPKDLVRTMAQQTKEIANAYKGNKTKDING